MLYDLTYLTLIRRDRAWKSVEADSPTAALRQVPRSAGGPLSLSDAASGRMLWHSQTGWIDGDPQHGFSVPRVIARIWPCPVWPLGEVRAYLARNADAGIFCKGGIAYVTANQHSGQDQHLRAAVVLRDILTLVDEGVLHCMPVCFKPHWFYHRGPCPNGKLAFPTRIPEDPRQRPSGLLVSEVMGRFPAAA
ncbi:hypothetical protein CKO28_01485 [Rhodovibrio sodomensis]|uniref:Uncharacterized protein n=1 Tax=Rhodovibrio sodomensis TaxID=1088 RepID=A0ABS1D8I4_9PROT|nr:hypothetical protein [Rhodovibrio sodomensis]MBK1666717.1 hypothetical protein [Rhodovibrio sodomensis]